MAEFTWTFDAPTGVYKSHKMSSRLYEAAVENSVFMDHVRPVEGYGRGNGETITLVRIASISEPVSVDLEESMRIPEDEFAISTRAITVNEIGRAVPFTNLAMDLSAFDLENPIQRKLTDQMRLALDTKAAAAFRSTAVKYQITGAATGVFTQNGVFAGDASANMNVFHVEEIRDFMYDTLLVPPAVDGDYIGIFRTLGLRGIKRDPDWEDWHRYTDPTVKFNGEIGRIESVRFVETNHANALRKVGTADVLGEGVVFGDDSVAIAEAMAPELRAAIPSDFGRSKAVAWYGILSFATIWETGNAGEAKIVHVGSLNN